MFDDTTAKLSIWFRKVYDNSLIFIAFVGVISNEDENDRKKAGSKKRCTNAPIKPNHTSICYVACWCLWIPGYFWLLVWPLIFSNEGKDSYFTVISWHWISFTRASSSSSRADWLYQSLSAVAECWFFPLCVDWWRQREKYVPKGNQSIRRDQTYITCSQFDVDYLLRNSPSFLIKGIQWRGRQELRKTTDLFLSLYVLCLNVSIVVISMIVAVSLNKEIKLFPL